MQVVRRQKLLNCLGFHCSKPTQQRSTHSNSRDRDLCLSSHLSTLKRFKLCVSQEGIKHEFLAFQVLLQYRMFLIKINRNSLIYVKIPSLAKNNYTTNINLLSSKREMMLPESCQSLEVQSFKYLTYGSKTRL